MTDVQAVAGRPAALARARTWQRVFRTRAEDALPIRIEHQRIYILPTSRGWAFLGALLLMLIAAVNYSLSLGYALCFLLTGMFSATLLHTYRNLAGIELRRVATDPVFAGERLPFVLTLANPTRLERHGVRVRTRERGEEAGGDAREARSPARGVEGRTDLAAGAEARLTLPVPTALRGPRPLGRLTLDSDWPLGLWRAWSYVHAPCAGLVFPRPEREPPALPAEPSAASGGATRHASRGDVAGLRPYVPGDAPTTIAWKSLARGQGLHVRTFDAEGGPSRTRLTLGATGLATVEAQLSRLAAWVLAAEATRADYAVELPAASLAAGRGDAQRRDALTALALHGKGSGEVGARDEDARSGAVRSGGQRPERGRGGR